MVRCQMRLEPQIFLAHVLVDQCFPERFIADFHSLFHLSGLGPAGTAPALWPFDHYTALVEKTQCCLAILLQKLRHTQRICSQFSLHQFRCQVLHPFCLHWVAAPMRFHPSGGTPHAFTWAQTISSPALCGADRFGPLGPTPARDSRWTFLCSRLRC